jgi:hypothetical protein
MPRIVPRSFRVVRLDPRMNLTWSVSYVVSMRSQTPLATSRSKSCTRFCEKDCVAEPVSRDVQ